MKRLAIGLVILGSALLPLMIASAAADPPVGGPPGQGECQHGNSGQECKPDPQPEHGQECEEHGPNEGGVNEDHCLPTTTTTTTSVPPPTTTVTETEPPPTTTTTATETPPETVTEEPTTAPTVPPVVTQPTTPSETTSNEPTTTGTSPDEKTPVEKPAKKLAFTGIEDVVPIGAAALTFLTVGSALLRAGRKRDRGE